MRNSSNILKQEMAETLTCMRKCGLWKKAAPLGGDPTMSAAVQARPSLANGPKTYWNLDTGEEVFNMQPGQSMRGNYMFTPSNKPGGVHIVSGDELFDYWVPNTDMVTSGDPKLMRIPVSEMSGTRIMANPAENEDPRIAGYLLNEDAGTWIPMFRKMPKRQDTPTSEVPFAGYLLNEDTGTWTPMFREVPKQQDTPTSEVPSSMRPSSHAIARAVMNSSEYNEPKDTFDDPRLTSLYGYMTSNPVGMQEAFDKGRQKYIRTLDSIQNARDWAASTVGASNHPGRNLAVGLPVGVAVSAAASHPVGILLGSTGLGYMQAATKDWLAENDYQTELQKQRTARMQLPGLNPYLDAARGKVGLFDNPKYTAALTGEGALYGWWAGRGRRGAILDTDFQKQLDDFNTADTKYTSDLSARRAALIDEAKAMYPDVPTSDPAYRTLRANRANYVTTNLNSWKNANPRPTAPVRPVPKTFDIPTWKGKVGVPIPVGVGRFARDMGIGIVGTNLGDWLYRHGKRNQEISDAVKHQLDYEAIHGRPRTGFGPMSTGPKGAPPSPAAPADPSKPLAAPGSFEN